MNILLRFLTALWNAGVFLVRTGRLTVEDHDRELRLSTCSACPHVKKFGALWQCRVCKCLVQGKAALITEKCPKDLWPA